MQDPRLPLADVEPGGASPGGLDLRRSWSIINMHRWSILGLTVLITLITGLFVYRQVPIYLGTATLQIERSPLQFSPVQDPYAVYADYWLYYKTQYGLIKRRAIGERVVERLGLIPPAAGSGAAQQSSFSWKSMFPSDWFSTTLPISNRKIAILFAPLTSAQKNTD